MANKTAKCKSPEIKKPMGNEAIFLIGGLCAKLIPYLPPMHFRAWMSWPGFCRETYQCFAPRLKGGASRRRHRVPQELRFSDTLKSLPFRDDGNVFDSVFLEQIHNANEMPESGIFIHVEQETGVLGRLYERCRAGIERL